MTKKIFLSFIFVFFMFANLAFSAPQSDKPELQPLKMEENVKQNYRYGTFDKTFKNSQMDKNAETQETQTQHKEPTALDIFSKLIFVIFLILLTGWIYMKIKRINPENLLSGKFNKLNENTFKIVSSLQLGAGKSIYLIEINGKQLIVGTTASSVNLLAQMEKTDNDAKIPEECIEKLFNDKTEEFKKLEE